MRIALSGYYGFGNAGDEAVLAAALAGIARRLPAARPLVLSPDPEATTREHGVEAAPRWPLRKLRATLCECDLLLSGGGTLLQDATSLRSMWYYTRVAALARRVGTPYAIFAQGVGPIRTWLGRRWAGGCLRGASAITVRDPDSVELALRLGVPSIDVQLAADPALLLEAQVSERVEEVMARLPEGRPLVGLAVRRWPGTEAAAMAMAEVGRMAQERWGAAVVVLPFQRPEDLGVSEGLAEAVRESVFVLDALQPAELLAIIGRLDLLVAMRLHALIFATSQRVPAVGVSYDPKVASFCATAGQPHVRAEAPEALMSAVAECWQNRQARAVAREAAAMELTRRAETNFDMVERLCRLGV